MKKTICWVFFLAVVCACQERKIEQNVEEDLSTEGFSFQSAIKHAYNIDNRVSEGGGNDYWETGVARPDLILKDITYIFHPELLPAHTLFYYRKLSDESSQNETLINFLICPG